MSLHNNALFMKLTEIYNLLFNGTAKMQLSGRIVEYAWLTGATQPTPTEAFAWGNEFNVSTGELTVYGWTGTAWVEVL